MSIEFFVIGTSSPHLIKGITKFCNQTGSYPTIWTCGPNEISQVKRTFPITNVLNVFDLACGDFQSIRQILGNNLLIVDCLLQKFHEDYSKERFMVLENLLHRSDPGGAYTHSELKDLINSFFLISLNLIDKFKPKFVFFEVAPHIMYDLALYYVAKKNKIPTLVLMDSNIAEISFATFDFENPYPFIKIPTGKQAKVEYKVEKVRSGISFQKNGVPFYMNRKKYGRSFSLMIRQSYGLVKNFLLNRVKAKENIRNCYEKIPGVLLCKKSGRDITKLKQFVIYCVIETYYAALAKKFNLAKLEDIRPYVYVPLSLQHERSTMPCAGFMYNQKSYITAIKELIPKGYNIVIKENPKQFDYGNLTGIPNREKCFYDDLNGCNVFFAPLDFPTHELISNSSCVAVTTGSAGFEAVVGHNIPVMCFSKNWYSHLEGVFYISKESELKSFLDLVNSKNLLIDQNKLQKQLIDLAQEALYLWPEGASVVENNWDQDAMSHNICELLNVVSGC